MRNDYEIISEGYDEDGINVVFVRRKWRDDLAKIRSDLCEICEKESKYLYRLAWRMVRHGCSRKNIEKCRLEARRLQWASYPLEIIDENVHWDYAFKI